MELELSFRKLELELRLSTTSFDYPDWLLKFVKVWLSLNCKRRADRAETSVWRRLEFLFKIETVSVYRQIKCVTSES